jgi:hypothetical protein
MTSWKALNDELDRWRDLGRVATFWWRDDDVEAPTPALDRLLALHQARGLPLALAVVPAGTAEPLLGRLAGMRRLSLLQHGYAHRNHASPEEKKIELGLHRPVARVMAELAAGREKLERLFGRRFRPVMVPPWNRIDARIVAALPRGGFTGVSTFGPRSARLAAPGLVQVNCHIDVMDWARRRFAGTAPVLGQAIRHLRARREGAADLTEPTGLMTHHLVHDRAAWAFIARFLDATASHPAGRWVAAAQAFRPAATTGRRADRAA